MALPTFIAAGAHASGTAGITPGLPTGLKDGDIMLLFVEYANEADIAIPTGWARVGTSQGTGTAGGTSATKLDVFWKRYAAGDAAPSVADAGNHTYGVILAFRGCIETGDPWNVENGGVEATSDTSLSATGNTTTVNDCLVVIACARMNDAAGAHFSAWTNANLANILERWDDGTTQGNGGGIGIATGEKATAGAYAATTATLSVTSVKGFKTIALKPAISPATNVDPRISHISSVIGATTLAHQTYADTDKLVVAVGVHQGTVSNVQFNGVAMTKIVGAATSFNETSELWYLDTPGAVTGNVTFTQTGGSAPSIIAMNVTNAKSGAPKSAGANGSSATSSVSITPDIPNTLLIDAAYAEANPTSYGSGQEEVAKKQAQSFENFWATQELVSVTTAQTQSAGLSSGQRWAHVVISIESKLYITTDTTPDIEFTGIDPQADDIIYNIQVSANADMSLPMLDKTSDVDAGFANVRTPADTSPFTSGEKMKFTVQAALDYGRWYYRVRGKDPLGSNVFGNWSTIRKFFIFKTDRELTKQLKATIPTTIDGHNLEDTNTDVFTGQQYTDVDTADDVRVVKTGSGSNKPYFYHRMKGSANSNFTINIEVQAADAGAVAGSSENTGLLSPGGSKSSFNVADAGNLNLSDDVYTTFDAVNDEAATNMVNLADIPAGKEITGLEVQLHVKINTTGVNHTLAVMIGTGDANYSTAKSLNDEITTTEQIITLGNSTDLWGRTWAPGDFSLTNVIEGWVKMRCDALSAGVTILVDFVQLKVYYRDPQKQLRADVWDDELNVWESIWTSNNHAANTDVNTAISKTTNLSKYYDANFWIIVRIYADYVTTLRIDRFTIDISASTTPINVADIGSGSEAVNITALINTNDTSSGVDNPAILALLNMSDSTIASEVLSLLANIAVSDIGGIAGEVIETLGIVVLSDNNIVATEVLSILASIAISDSGTISQEAISILAQIAITESISSSEDLSIQATKAVSDLASSTDALQTLVIIGLSDFVTYSEAISILVSLAVSDSVISSEIISILASIVIQDVGSASTETVSILSQFNLTDFGMGLDALSILVALAVSDSAIGLDATNTLSSLATTDSGMGNDIVTILAQIAVGDMGVGNETLITLLNSVPISDAGIGTEALNILAALAIYDSGLGIEIVQILYQFTLSDNATLAAESVGILAQIAIVDAGTVSDEAIGALRYAAISETAIGRDYILEVLRTSGLSLRGNQLFNKTSNIYNNSGNSLYNKNANVSISSGQIQNANKP